MRLFINPLSTISATSRLASSVTRSPSMRCSAIPSFAPNSVTALPPPCTITGKWPSAITACTAFTSPNKNVSSSSSLPPTLSTTT